MEHPPSLEQKPMRRRMPWTASIIDDLREVFGDDQIDLSIKKGMAGIPGYFHAVENGHEVGTPFRAPGHLIAPRAKLEEGR